MYSCARREILGLGRSSMPIEPGVCMTQLCANTMKEKGTTRETVSRLCTRVKTERTYMISGHNNTME